MADMQLLDKRKDGKQGLSEIWQPSKERRVDYGLCTNEWKILYKDD